MARRDARDAPAPRVRAGRHPGAYRGLGGAAVRALDAGHQLDERAAGGLLFVPEGTDEGAADRLGGDSQGGCGGLLLAAHTGYEQVHDAPLGVGAVGADAVEQACGTGGQLGEVVVVRADADAADGGASLRLLDGQAREFEGVTGAVGGADGAECPGEAGDVELSDSDAHPEAVIAGGHQRRVQCIAGPVEGALNLVRVGLGEGNTRVELGEFVRQCSE